MPTPTLSDKIKVALRISTNLLDTEISDNIAAAKAEMKRAGLSDETITSEGDLVEQAIKTYVLAFMGNDLDDNDRYMNSFEHQLDQLRKSTNVQ